MLSFLHTHIQNWVLTLHPTRAIHPGPRFPGLFGSGMPGMTLRAVHDWGRRLGENRFIYICLWVCFCMYCMFVCVCVCVCMYICISMYASIRDAYIIHTNLTHAHMLHTKTYMYIIHTQNKKFTQTHDTYTIHKGCKNKNMCMYISFPCHIAHGYSIHGSIIVRTRRYVIHKSYIRTECKYVWISSGIFSIFGTFHIYHTNITHQSTCTFCCSKSRIQNTHTYTYHNALCCTVL